MEADGVRAMVAWLGRAPEHFVRALPGARVPAPEIRPAAHTGILRFDTAALYNALGRARHRRLLSWNQLASEIGDNVNAPMLTRLKRRGRISMDVAVAAAGWLGASVESFTYESRR